MMNRAKSKLRFLVFGGMALAATFCMTAAPTHANEVVTIGGTEYEITTVYTSFAAIESTLEDQPWWDNPSLAAAFESAVGATLGTPNSLTRAPTSSDGPLFAYGSVTLPSVGIPLIDAAFYDATDQTIDTTGTITEVTFYTWAEASPVATPEPGTLILMLTGIGLLGLLMIRKRIPLGLQGVSRTYGICASWQAQRGG
jgi:hypothetical protein